MHLYALSQMMKCHRSRWSDRRMSAVFGVRLMGLGPRDLVRAWAAWAAYHLGYLQRCSNMAGKFTMNLDDFPREKGYFQGILVRPQMGLWWVITYKNTGSSSLKIGESWPSPKISRISGAGTNRFQLWGSNLTTRDLSAWMNSGDFLYQSIMSAIVNP